MINQEKVVSVSITVTESGVVQIHTNLKAISVLHLLASAQKVIIEKEFIENAEESQEAQ